MRFFKRGWRQWTAKAGRPTCRLSAGAPLGDTVLGEVANVPLWLIGPLAYTKIVTLLTPHLLTPH